ncbi:MAG: hypothetical protein QF739_10680, partial [Acidimicrobiales bacterium]|nr:hypothetical protein [Acidimicrobiales bacterium]
SGGLPPPQSAGFAHRRPVLLRHRGVLEVVRAERRPRTRVLVLELDKSGLPKGAPAGLNLELIRDAIEPQTIWDLQGRKRQQSIWWFRAEPLFNDRFTYEQVNGEIDRRRREVEAWAHR